jgi:hypothetical protein
LATFDPHVCFVFCGLARRRPDGREATEGAAIAIQKLVCFRRPPQKLVKTLSIGFSA